VSCSDTTRGPIAALTVLHYMVCGAPRQPSHAVHAKAVPTGHPCGVLYCMPPYLSIQHIAPTTQDPEKTMALYMQAFDM